MCICVYVCVYMCIYVYMCVCLPLRLLISNSVTSCTSAFEVQMVELGATE